MSEVGDNIILEPVRAYRDVYEREFADRARAHADGLIAQSGVDAAQNRAATRQYYAEIAARNAVGNKLSSSRALRVFLIILSVIGFIAAAAGIYLLVTGSTVAGAITLPVGLTTGIVATLVITLVLNGNIERHRAQYAAHNAKAEELQAQAYSQLTPLFGLFDSHDTKNLIEATVPLLKIDDNFNMRRYDYLSGKYGFGDNNDENSSTLEVLTGEICGNPFVIDRELVMNMGVCTYSGSITIHWTTTSYDSEGHAHTEHHSETLVATVTKPKPYYSEHTRLVYGNEAAPDLCFSHAPSHAEQLDDKALERRIRSGIKTIRKKQAKALNSGSVGGFTEMGNEQFDVLFGALDRNNEVQFRLLFTPLGQKNMLDLMKSNVGFGDDFYFDKRGCLNYISSEHSQYWDLNTAASRYAHFDIDELIRGFVAFNAAYFKSLFFELAPLLSIPLYQQHKPHEYIYRDVYARNYTSYEAETAVNRMGERQFEHECSGTRAILKTVLIGKDGKSDKVGVTAYSYRAEDRVDYVEKFGGDGCLHSVPVHWTEYIPVRKQSCVRLKELDLSDKQFQAIRSGENAQRLLDSMGGIHSYSRGILCSLTPDYESDFDARINDIFRNANKI